MRLSFIIIGLLIVGLFGAQFSTILFDDSFHSTYSPNMSEYNNNANYANLLNEMNESHEKATSLYGSISDNTIKEDESSIFAVGSRILSAIKSVTGLANLAIVNNLISTSITDILGLDGKTAIVVRYMIFVSIIFAIISALLRWKS